MSWLLPLNDEDDAYHVVACHDVEEERFSPFGSDKDWGQRQLRFESRQSLLCFLSPDKHVRLFEKLVERHPPLA